MRRDRKRTPRMTPPRYNGASPGANTNPARRASAAHRRTRKRRAESGHTRTLALPDHPDSDPERVFTARQLEDLWDRHGTSVYTLACAILGDEAAAAQAVTLRDDRPRPLDRQRLQHRRPPFLGSPHLLAQPRTRRRDTPHAASTKGHGVARTTRRASTLMPGAVPLRRAQLSRGGRPARPTAHDGGRPADIRPQRSQAIAC